MRGYSAAATQPERTSTMRRLALLALTGALAGTILVSPSGADSYSFDWNPWSQAELERTLAEDARNLDLQGSVVGRSPTLSTVPKAQCRPGDPIESGLQGQVPLADRLTGRAAQGYACNMDRIGNLKAYSFTSFDTYGDCAYFGDSTTSGGTIVVDVRDRRAPVQTDYLRTNAMTKPWESLKVHAQRGLLVANTNVDDSLDVYDVSSDCRRPRLLAQVAVAGARGHEGWFSPDGRTYWMAGTSTSTLTAVDLSVPSRPRALVTLDSVGAPHSGSTSPDGSRTYVCQQGNLTPQPGETADAVVILDTTQIKQRVREPRVRVVGTVPLPDNTWCQSAQHVTYGGKPFLIQYGERTPAHHTKCTDVRTPQYSYPRIFDISDERYPTVVSRLFLEIDDPAYCAITSADVNAVAQGMDAEDIAFRQALSVIFQYDVHHCTPDRLIDPTVMACSYFKGGMRVFDIRDPQRPRDLAYVNVGTVSPTDPTIDNAVARPVVRIMDREVWWVTQLGGLQVARFADGVLPVQSLRCPRHRDPHFEHYNPGACR
jgi:hypothetical protein